MSPTTSPVVLLERVGRRFGTQVALDSQLVGGGITTVLDSLAIGYLVDTGQRPRDPRPLVEAIRTARGAGLSVPITTCTCGAR